MVICYFSSSSVLAKSSNRLLGVHISMCFKPKYLSLFLGYHSRSSTSNSIISLSLFTLVATATAPIGHAPVSIKLVCIKAGSVISGGTGVILLRIDYNLA